MHSPRLRHQAVRWEYDGTGHEGAGWSQHIYDPYITTAPTDEHGCRNQRYRSSIFGRDKHNPHYRVSQERAFGAHNQEFSVACRSLLYILSGRQTLF